MVGSSVNNDMVGLLADHPEITLLSGLNMPLVLGLVLNEDLGGPALGQTIDTAPVTGAKITVAAVDDAFVTFREQAAGYSADYWYDRTSGALSHVRFVDRTAGQVVDQKRTH